MKPKQWIAMAALGVLGSIALAQAASDPTYGPSFAGGPGATEPAPKYKSIYLGGGCFWCVEAVFEMIKGVKDVESGYMGGSIPNPTYDQVCSGQTGHAEIVKITYDPRQISEADLLKVFFVSHDPTTLNQQGPDVGTQYRSVIFYQNPTERELAQNVIRELTAQKLYSKKIVTTLEPLSTYYRAEEYHQDYYDKYSRATPDQRAMMNAGYCSRIITPKLQKFREKYTDKLKRQG